MTAREMRKAQVRVGTSIVAYTVTGTGPGLVLVHGAGADKDTNWGPLTAQLQDRFTVVAMDLSGSGETIDDGGPIELAHLIAQVVGAAHDAGIGSFHLVGYSMGALVSAAVAASHPALVRSLTLIAGWTHNTTRMRHEFDLWERLFIIDRELWVRFAVLLGSGPEFMAAVSPEQLAEVVQGFVQITPEGVGRQANFIARADIRPLLPKITAPTRVIGLLYDQMVLLEYSHELRAAIVGAEYSEIASGHMAPWQHPSEFVDAVAAFVTALPA